MAGLSFVIAGKPFTKNTRRWNPKAGKVYTAREGVEYQGRVRDLALEARNKYDSAPAQAMVSVDRPPMTEATRAAVAQLARAAARWPMTGVFHVSVLMHVRPKTVIDIDNVAKPILDGCTGVLWDDDRQVHSLTLERLPAGPGEEEQTHVFVAWTAARPAQEALA